MKELFTKVYKKSKEALFQELKDRLLQNEKTFVITANPEIFMRAEQNHDIHDLLMREDIYVTPDGEGIVKGASMLDMPVWGKIAGVDTVSYLLKAANDANKKLFVYGSKQEVLDAFAQLLEKQYPNLLIAGLKNGYDSNEQEVFEEMRQAAPDVVLIALGVPRQEQLIEAHYHEFTKGIFLGVGGSIDVISGMKKRAPQFFIDMKLEWLYRIAKEPKRFKRFYQSNIKYIFRIRHLAKEKSK